MTHAEKRKAIQETIIELHRAIKALQALDSEMAANDSMMWTSSIVRGKAKRASMDATRALSAYRKISIY